MRRHSASGFTLVELLVAAALFCVVSAVLLRLTVTGQQTVLSQGDIADLQQRLRVAASALHDDLLLAGAGPSQGPVRGSLAALLPPIVPARTGDRRADPEGFHATDRLTLLHVPDSGSQTALAADAGGAGAPLVIDAAAPGCPRDGACGFSPGNRVLVFDPSGSGAYDVFTVEAVAAGQVWPAPGSSWSYAYPRGSPVVSVTQRVYYLDRASQRFMRYDGAGSDNPLVDGVVDLRFTYYAGPFWQELSAADLTDGPLAGTAPHRFDPDLLRIRRVRVTMTVEAPGAARGLDARLRRQRVTFDVTPRNLGEAREGS